ncbi:MAG: hypothetical protein KAS23_13225 [Anaerohalosphaera sp.]|nr:hypothetical protein [Anaerohalosphaera sp.]
MTIFKWRLDRILEIKRKDEQLKRSEAADIAQKLEMTRKQLLDKQDSLKRLMDRINCQNPKERFQHQQIFINSSQADDNDIQIIKNSISALEQQKIQKIQEIIEAKSFVERLEKLRQKNYEQFLIEQNKIEQSELDENYNRRFTKAIAGTAI